MKLSPLNSILSVLISRISSEYVYIDQTSKGWHLEPLRLLMQQNNLDFDINSFSEYGCWCGANTGPHGKPVDELDTICHQMYQCIKCVNLNLESDCSALSNFWFVDVNENSLNCNLANDKCIEQRCGCTEHVLNKVVKFLSKNPGHEKSKPICEPHHNLNNGYEMVKSISKFDSVLPSIVPMIVPEGNMMTGEILKLRDDAPELVDRTQPKLEGKIESDLNNHEVAMRKMLMLPAGGVSLKSGLDLNSDVETLRASGSFKMEENSNSHLFNNYNSFEVEPNQKQDKSSKKFETTYNSQIQQVFHQTIEENTKPITHNACCGAYPEWHPYDKEGTKQCCAGKTYDIFSLQCCESGAIVKKDGTCPEDRVIMFVNEEHEQEQVIHARNVNRVQNLHTDVENSVRAVPSCDSDKSEILIKNDANNWYKCQNRFDQIYDENANCRSTDNCRYSEPPTCENNTKLVHYPMDDCCNYYYCAPSFENNSCSEEEMNQCDITEDNLEKCGKYQLQVTDLDSFMDCCPKTNCVCDYNKCPREPVCGSNEFLLSEKSADDCCYDYQCVSVI